MRYRQIAHKLRVQMGPGNPDWVSERPRNQRTRRFLDMGEDGRSTTVVDVPDGAHVVELLKIGALEEIEQAGPDTEGDHVR